MAWREEFGSEPCLGDCLIKTARMATAGKPLVSDESRPDTCLVGGACPSCGRRFDGREEFCAGCGAFLGWDASGAAESQLYPQPAQPDDQRAAVQLQIKSDLIKVTPGASESTTVTAKNLGTKVEELRFEVAGPVWIVIEPAVVSVYPGQEASSVVQVAPPRAPTSAAGITPFQITVTSAVHAHVSSSVACRADVAPYFELAAELVPTSSVGRRMTRHHVKLENRGNVPMRIGLSATDVADGLRLGIPAVADVGPGVVTEVPVSVQASFRWIGRPEPKSFSVIAEGPRPLSPMRLPGTRTVIPLLPRWVPATAIGLAAAAVAAAVLVPKLHAHNSALHSHGAKTAASSAASSSPGSSPSAVPSSAAPSASASPATSPPYDLVSAAAGAQWASLSPVGHIALPVKVAVGCQNGGTGGAGEGSVYSLTQVVLEDGTLASTALETDPPGRESASVSGDYMLPAATQGAEDFRAYVGFCGGTGSLNQMRYSVTVGTQTVASAQVDSSSGQLASVDVPLPPGTTQIDLSVTFMGANQAGIVWVDPRIEAQNAPPPAPRPAA